MCVCVCVWLKGAKQILLASAPYMHFINLNGTPHTHTHTHTHIHMLGIVFNIFQCIWLWVSCGASTAAVTFPLIDVVACANDCSSSVPIYIYIYIMCVFYTFKGEKKIRHTQRIQLLACPEHCSTAFASVFLIASQIGTAL